MSSVAKPAIFSTTLRFLTAGGLTLVVSIVSEVLKPDTDWWLVANMSAGLVVGVLGGAYGRIVAQGPIRGVLRSPD
ncbi:MAG: hypothetical protein R3C52_05215 [Hyphomonadaceae bacterium]